MFKNNDPHKYQNYTHQELIDLLCAAMTDIQILKESLRLTGYDMTAVIPHSAYDEYFKLKVSHV